MGFTTIKFEDARHKPNEDVGTRNAKRTEFGPDVMG